METSRIEQLLLKDRLIISTAMAGIFLIAAIYTLLGVGMPMSALEMTMADGMVTSMPVMSSDTGINDQGMAKMMMPAVWSARYAVLVFLMWWVMMIAMMTPSVAPIILLQARAARHAIAKGAENASALRQTGAFAAGYLLIWLAFSGAATFLQWALEAGGLLSAMTMGSQSTWLSAALLFAAGAYQLSPIKNFCLRHCQAPATFLSRHWRPGTGGAIRMGLVHGAYCVGCCWALMALLFVGGVMNPIWVLALATIVLLEKIGPYGAIIGKAGGGLLLLWSGATLLV